MQPVVPIYDIAGNFASGKAVEPGQPDQPAQVRLRAPQQHQPQQPRLRQRRSPASSVLPALALRSSIGFNVRAGHVQGLQPDHARELRARLQRTRSTSSRTSNFDWTWTNTAPLQQDAGPAHAQPARRPGSQPQARTAASTAAMANFRSTDPNNLYIQAALGDASTPNVTTRTAAQSALLSYFGKADYNFQDKYVASVTVRRDGSSRLGPDHRWGTFPAFGLGWRITKEAFLENNKILSDAMLRFGYGVTGNQQIPSGRIVVAVRRRPRRHVLRHHGLEQLDRQPGFRQTALGNADLKWEENRSHERRRRPRPVQRLPERHRRRLPAVRRTTCSSTRRFRPRPASPSAPIVNIGKMQNNGLRSSRSATGRSSWNATIQGSHYKNEIVSIDGVQNFFYGPVATRFGNQVINKVGQPIGAFYGYMADGYFNDAAEVAACMPTQDGAELGSHQVRATSTATERSRRTTARSSAARIRSSPGRSTWATGTATSTSAARCSASFGNDIFDAQKEFYVFREFSTNVRDGPARELVDADEHRTRSIRASTSTDSYSHAISELLRRGRLVRPHAQRPARLQRAAALSLAGCQRDARVRAGGEPLHDHGLRRSRSGAAGGRHQRRRRRHPRPVPWRRSGRRTRRAGRSASASPPRSNR